MRAVVTGAAGGIGRAVAEGLARAGGASLLLVDLDEARLAATGDAVRSLGARVEIETADLNDPAVPQRLVDRAGTLFGGLDALVSNAGIIAAGALADLSLDAYDRAFSINARATWLLARAAYPLLAASKGAIVATGSISAEHPTPPLGAYAASKAALVMLVRQMALEWGPEGIRANVVSPGPTLTPLTADAYADAERKAQREAAIPLRRLATPEDVAAMILFLLTPAGGYVSGQNITVDGGMGTMLMPGTGSGGGHR